MVDRVEDCCPALRCRRDGSVWRRWAAKRQLGTSDPSLRRVSNKPRQPRPGRTRYALSACVGGSLVAILAVCPRGVQIGEELPGPASAKLTVAEMAVVPIERTLCCDVASQTSGEGVSAALRRACGLGRARAAGGGGVRAARRALRRLSARLQGRPPGGR